MATYDNKHYGPGPHKSGSPQAVHGHRFSSASDRADLRAKLQGMEDEGRAAGWQITERAKSAFYTNHITSKEPAGDNPQGHRYGDPALRLFARLLDGIPTWHIQEGRVANGQFVPERTVPFSAAGDVPSLDSARRLLDLHATRSKGLVVSDDSGDYPLPNPGFHILHDGGGHWSSNHIRAGTPQEAHDA